MKAKKQKNSVNKVSDLTWKSVEIRAKDINPTPNNYKIKTELGNERLEKSMELFGLAGTILVNPSKKPGQYDLINGNSRWEKQMAKNPNAKMNCSVPSRRLTPKEYIEMAAMVDFAVAGEVDTERINKELGTAEDFFKKWGMEVPFEVLEKLGKTVPMDKLLFPEGSNGNGKNVGDSNVPKDIRMVNLFFSDTEEQEFRKMEDVFALRYKTDDTTQISLKVYKELFKLLKLKYGK